MNPCHIGLPSPSRTSIDPVSVGRSMLPFQALTGPRLFHVSGERRMNKPHKIPLILASINTPGIVHFHVAFTAGLGCAAGTAR